MNKRVLYVLPLFMCLMSAQASVFKLADVLISSIDLKTKIASEGISGASVNRLKSYIDTSVDSIMTKSDSSLYESVKSLSVNSADKSRKERLLRKLNQNSDNVNSDDFVDTVNDLVFLADRYGLRSASTLSCSVCVSDQLSNLGFKTSIRKVGQKSLLKYLKRVPRSSRSLVLFNKKLAKKLNINDDFKYLREDEHKAMAFFLQVAAKSDGSYKKLSQSILDFNKVDGIVHLAGPKANSKLWKLYTTNLSDSKALRLSNIISKASKLKDVQQRERMFYSELEVIAKSDNSKLSKVDKLKKQNCFFK